MALIRTSYFKDSRIFYYMSVFFLATGFGLIHMYHVSTLFENERRFSHLSQLEREMTFRTEMGFYYYFYKRIVEAESFSQGIHYILNENNTQFPLVINALQSYNLYPELVIGGLFRVFDSATKFLQIDAKQCWVVERGSSGPAVTSCDGIGEPMHFYLHFVWLCAGLSKAVLFMYAVSLSGSLTGGLLAILGFLYNHGHCTRIQWTPPLRESFAYPFCLIQIMTVSVFLRGLNSERTFFQTLRQLWSITFSTVLCLVLWQFSQFMVASQAAALLLMFCLGIIQKDVLLLIVTSVLIALIQSWVILLGNELLLQSLLLSLLLAVLLTVCHCDDRLSPFTFRPVLLLTSIAGIMFCIKAKINQVYGFHDEHIVDVMRAKFTKFRNFHTMLYTCSAEFDFLPWSTIHDLTATCLLPAVCVVCWLLLRRWRSSAMLRTDVELVYAVLQLAAFTVMALLVMRLKLFWTPHLCLISSLLMSSKLLPSNRFQLRYAMLVALIAAMSYKGIANIVSQKSVSGEFSNPPLEEVLSWVAAETKPRAVFAGTMADMANVLLSTGRPIVNNPHYEHFTMRDRTLKIYSLFSRKPPQEVYTTLLSMGVDYVLLHEHWCFRQRGECSMVDVWDLFDVDNRYRPSLCEKLFHDNPAPFSRVFRNRVYAILALTRPRHHTFQRASPMPQYQM